MNEIKSLKIENFARLFQVSPGDFPEVCRTIMSSCDFRYRRLSQQKRDAVLLQIVNRIHSSHLSVSGQGRHGDWEKGWSGNFEAYQHTKDVSALTPKFIQKDRILRLDEDYVEVFDDGFEFNFIDVLRHFLFSKYFSEVNSVYDFGCGSCQHFPVLAKLFPGKELHGLDWAVASSHIMEKLRQDHGWNLKGHVFNMFEPDEKLVLGDQCGVYTVGALEQIGKNFEKFLQFLLKNPIAVCIHLETITELYDEDSLFDNLALQYDRKRNYLDGYLTRLRELEAQGKIEILAARKLSFGSLYHDSYGTIIWRPKRK